MTANQSTVVRSFPIMVTFGQLVVFDHSLDRPFNLWSDRHVAQGFSWRPGSVSFRTSDGMHSVTVDAARTGEIAVPRHVRVIDVAFEVPASGLIEIGSISDTTTLDLLPGNYQLRFRISEGAGGSQPKAHVTFLPASNPVFRVTHENGEMSEGEDLLLLASPG